MPAFKSKIDIQSIVAEGLEYLRKEFSAPLDRLKSIADKKMILADLQSALNDTFDEFEIKGNEFIAKGKVVDDLEREMNNMAKSGIEIKPENQTLVEKVGKNRYNQAQLIINKAKWSSAQMWCKNKGFRFRVINEKDIFHGGKR